MRDQQNEPEGRAEFEAVLVQYTAAGERLAQLAEQLALAEVRTLLPEAAVVEVHGWMNEDWLKVLRIRAVRSDTGTTLFDVEAGAEPEIEDALHEIGTELLDLLVDLTGDAFMGTYTLEVGPASTRAS